MLVKIHPDNPNPKGIAQIVECLKYGGIIIYPTDTIYGFGCDARNEKAIERLNNIKGRSAPMSVLCPSFQNVLSWIDLPNHEKAIVEKQIKPKTTLIVPVKSNVVSSLILGNGNTLGIRISNHPFCISIAHNYPSPITTTSVNRSGHEPLSDPYKIELEFSNEIELCIDDGVIKGQGSKKKKKKNQSWTLIRS